MASEPIDLRCPACNRWLAQGQGFVRAVCRDCGCEAVYRDREDRRRFELFRLPHGTYAWVDKCASSV